MKDSQTPISTAIREALHSRKITYTPISFLSKAKRISDQFKHYVNRLKNIKQSKHIDVTVKEYSGTNKYVLKMSDFLQKHLDDDLFGAYVHGSLGTYDEIKFSDFDALVIVKKEVISSSTRLAKVLSKLHSSSKIMYEFDSLQHHGWFVLTELDLACYPDCYFPHELFKYAKSLLVNKGNELAITISENEDYSRNLVMLANGIITRLEKGYYPGNTYDLKSLLSGFMLLPALYVQARDRKGIYKKYSFEEAKVDFEVDEWSIMDEVSAIRGNWYNKNTFFQHYIMSKPDFWARKLSKKIAPNIPKNIQEILSPCFFQRILKLTKKMKEFQGTSINSKRF